jgi:hypothetical protein
MSAYSTATNAAHSSFLLLPPEVRGRIYDYAFGGNGVHVTHDSRRKLDGKRCYRLDICCAQDDDPPQRIVHLPPPKVHIKCGSPSTPDDDCAHEDTRKEVTQRDLPLSLLRVCRQIYHEAALKPFSQTIFIVREKWYIGSHAFLDALIPTQARTIKQIRFVCIDGQCPAHKVMQHLKGLETLKFQLVEGFKAGEPYRFDFMFEHLEKNLRRVTDLDLKSFHISMLVDDTFTAAEKKFIAEHLERTETSSRQIAA